MEILLAKETGSIRLQDIKTNHIIVGRKNNKPLIMSKDYDGDDYEFFIIRGDDIADYEGNITFGDSYALTGGTLQDKIEHAITKLNIVVEAFEPGDWKGALQWLIDNCE